MFRRVSSQDEDNKSSRNLNDWSIYFLDGRHETDIAVKQETKSIPCVYKYVQGSFVFVKYKNTQISNTPASHHYLLVSLLFIISFMDTNSFPCYMCIQKKYMYTYQFVISMSFKAVAIRKPIYTVGKP